MSLHKFWPVRYCPDQMWAYPLVTVFAPSKAAADKLAGPDRFDQRAYFDLAMDAAEAQSRLGVWGDVASMSRIERGD